MRWVWGLSLLAGCLDVSLPPQRIAGRVTASVLAQRPGRSELVPAVGATLELLETGLSATADVDGNVVLDGLTGSTGTLRLAWDADGDGSADAARLIDVRTARVGPGTSVSLGIIVLGRLASASGVVRRGDRPSTTGHGGVQVFLPSSPSSTISADDGSWVLDGLPEGQVALSFFGAGYRPESSRVELKAGQRARLDDVRLSPAAASTTSVSGTVREPSGRALSGVLVEVLGGPSTRSGEAGDFELLALSTGVVSLAFRKEGFASFELPNVLLDETPRRFEVVLTPGDVDAGRPTTSRDGGASASTVTLIARSTARDPADGGLITIHPLAMPGDLLVVGHAVTGLVAGIKANPGWPQLASGLSTSDVVTWVSHRVVPNDQPLFVPSDNASVWIQYVFRGAETAAVDGPMMANTQQVVFPRLPAAPGDFVLHAAKFSIDQQFTTTSPLTLRDVNGFCILEEPVGSSGIAAGGTISGQLQQNSFFAVQIRVLGRP